MRRFLNARDTVYEARNARSDLQRAVLRCYRATALPTAATHRSHAPRALAGRHSGSSSLSARPQARRGLEPQSAAPGRHMCAAHHARHRLLRPRHGADLPTPPGQPSRCPPPHCPWSSSAAGGRWRAPTGPPFTEASSPVIPSVHGCTMLGEVQAPPTTLAFSPPPAEH